MSNGRFSRMGQTRQQFFDNRDSNKKLAYERKFVRKLFRRLGVTDLEMKTVAPESPDEAEWFLTLGWLHANFSSMPIRLMAHEIWMPNLYDFFHPSKRRKLWSGWNEVRTVLSGEVDKGIAIGCVFPAPVESGLGDMILHNRADLPFEGLSGEAFSRMHCITEEGEHITLERLDTFASRLGAIWKPYF